MIHIQIVQKWENKYYFCLYKKKILRVGPTLHYIICTSKVQVGKIL